MLGGRRIGISLAMTAAMSLLSALPVRAGVALEWRPTVIAASPNDTIEIGAYAVSDSGFGEVFSGLSLLFTWDPTHLELLGFVEPCPQEPCDPGTYHWIQSWFPDDSQLDGINNDLTDGDAFFQVFGQLGFDASPIALPSGLRVTTFRFRVLGSGTSEVAIAPQIGNTKTRVAGGDIPGLEVTGALGPPVRVVSVDCAAPAVAGTGSRYLAITPAGGTDPVALRVAGAVGEGDVSCVAQYVQADGSLGATRVFRMPSAWATVHVTGEAILPSTMYRVRADCSEASPGLVTSSFSSATTWRWGDTNGDGMVAFTDVSRVIDSTGGALPPGTMLDAVDLSPCVPDGAVTQADVDAALAAVGLQPFPCAAPCVTTDLVDLPGFVDCMDGPFMARTPTCGFFDFDGDNDVDVGDFGVFQRRFSVSGN